MSNIVSTALRSLSSRREAREQEESYEREFMKSSTRAGFWDLEAALDRYPDNVTSELSRIWAAARRV